MERTIRVTGRGALKLRPDFVRLNLELTGKEAEYDKAVAKAAELTETVAAAAGKHGFERKDVKTLSLDVDPKYEYYEDRKDRSRHSRLVGYRYTHRVKIEFPIDNERLGQLLYTLSHTDARPEIGIQFFVSDVEAAKNELLAKAVRDSRAKAEILASAAGVALGEIETIDYSRGEIELVSRRVAYCGAGAADCCEENSYALAVEPDDIDVDDSVTIVWSIG